MSPRILHLDLDAFFCAVEENQDSSLTGKPFAVGGKPEARGVVASCSYPARRFGVRSAMPMARALRQCPDLRILPPRHHLYSQVSRQVMQCLFELTPLVEQISIDEAFLDISEIPGSGEEIARQLQVQIHDQLGLPCSLGVASNKLVAKIANDYGKNAYRGEGPPCAITVVMPGQETEFLNPLPVIALWGVGPKTAAKLEEIGVHTIGDLAEHPVEDLERRFGKNGIEMSRHAQGIDERPVVTFYEPKSISQETTFSHDVRDEKILLQTLDELARGVSARLRSASLSGSTVKIKLRWQDFTTLTRQVTLLAPTDQYSIIFASATQLFQKTWKKGKPVRLIGIGVSGFGSRELQLTLWDTTQDFQAK